MRDVIDIYCLKRERDSDREPNYQSIKATLLHYFFPSHTMKKTSLYSFTFVIYLAHQQTQCVNVPLMTIKIIIKILPESNYDKKSRNLKE